MMDDVDVNRELRRKEKEFRADIAWLASSARGRRILNNLFDQCGLFARTIDTNALLMANNEGRRAVGNGLFGIIADECPESFLLMMKERNDSK